MIGREMSKRSKWEAHGFESLCQKRIFSRKISMKVSLYNLIVEFADYISLSCVTELVADGPRIVNDLKKNPIFSKFYS